MEVRIFCTSHATLLKSLLVLALLFVQQGAVTHTISHAFAEQTQDQSLPHDQQCDLCAAYTQIGSVDVHFDFTLSFAEARNDAPVAFRSVTFAAFAARAPPRSI